MLFTPLGRRFYKKNSFFSQEFSAFMLFHMGLKNAYYLLELCVYYKFRGPIPFNSGKWL